MKVVDARLEAMAANPSQFPPGGLVEVALAGRSNVGKSSFINSLAGRKKLAYTSQTPGKTRTVNFYRLKFRDQGGQDREFRLVDLPGYGFAKASRTDQDQWAQRIGSYLEKRSQLQEIFLLVDLRHLPTAEDKQMLDWILYQDFSPYVIASKADKVPVTKRLPQAGRIAQALQLAEGRIFPYAAGLGQKSMGLSPIADLLEELLAAGATD